MTLEDHLHKLTSIAVACGEPLEGNCYTYHLHHSRATELESKRRNLAKVSKLCTNILEIGFNAGHSACIFLYSNPDVHVVTVDNCAHIYTQPCYEYLRSVFNNRISMIACDSINLTKHLEVKIPHQFDGVHIDGAHDNAYFIYDTLTCMRYTKNKAYFILDDTQDTSINLFADYLNMTVMFTRCDEFEETSLYKHQIFKFHRPSVAIATLAVGESYVARLAPCIESKREYAAKYGYTLVDGAEIYDSTRPPQWSKINQIKKALETHDIVLWIDADTYIMNTDITLDDMAILMPKEASIFIGNDLNAINSGVFMVQNTEVTHRFLDEVYNQTDLIHATWWEQAAIIRLINEKGYNQYTVVTRRDQTRMFNAYIPEIDPVCYYKPGDFILHFAGLVHDTLDSYISKYANHPRTFDTLTTRQKVTDLISDVMLRIYIVSQEQSATQNNPK